MEKDFIKPIIKEIKRRGYGVIDMQPLGNGVPDYYVFGDCSAFVEFKLGDNVLTRHQEVWIEENKTPLLTSLYYLVSKKGGKYFCYLVAAGRVRFVNERAYPTIKLLVDRLTGQGEGSI